MATRIRATLRAILADVFRRHGNEVPVEVVRRRVDQEYDLPGSWRIRIPMGNAYNRLKADGIRWQDLPQRELRQRVSTEDRWWNALRYAARDFRDWGWMEEADGAIWSLSDTGRRAIRSFDFTTLSSDELRIVFGASAQTVASPLKPREAEGDQSSQTDRVERSILDRRGQPAFRAALISAYGATCAITGCDALDALEAAHIVAVKDGGPNTVSNGLLLRADVHTLHDLGLLAISPDTGLVAVSPRLTNTSYGSLHGRSANTPVGDSRPDPDYLRERWEAFRTGSGTD